jgi:DNA mismatch repair protein MutL
MGRITRLPEDLANQIAAGEVVERPASVVKELVENAIDAEAARITITTEYGGKKLIRVEDDGIGMEPGDARLSLERHATSKIRRADDLGAIVTLGFRGEALPSIASVSHFRPADARQRGNRAAPRFASTAGLLESVMEAGGPEGTLIEVSDLFYNLPARRKFLKSDAAESAQVSKTVTQLALCYPRGRLRAGERRAQGAVVPPVASVSRSPVPDCTATARPRRGAARVGGLRIHGYVAALAEQGPTRGPQHVFVNRRIVKDKTIAHAIFDAYSVASNKERSPEVHLFLEMPPDRVDVNVHPTKAEVRFKEQSLVHEVVRRAVADALGRGPAPELQLRPSDVLPGRPIPQAIPGVLGGGVYTSRWSPAGAQVQGSNVQGTPVQGPYVQSTSVPSANVHSTDAQSTEVRGAEGHAPGVVGLRPLIPLGQFRDTFIIAIDDEGIAIIDQHVAHERVLFERIMQRLTERPLESQRLLVPLILEMPPAERQALVSRADALGRFGFEVEEFGGDTVKVTAIPAVLPTHECESALRDLANDLEGLDRGLGVEEGLKRIAALTACHAAVKANYPLTFEKMAHILEELRATAYSTVCPHGRPVMLRITRREVEKNFDRI